MSPYICKSCNYTTKIKTHFNRHLKTKKHLETNKLYGMIFSNSKKGIKMSTNEHKMSTNENRSFQCNYCKLYFSTKPNMRRHEIHFCKIAKNEKSKNAEMALIMGIHNQEKEKLHKYIETLLETRSNTNNSHDSMDNIHLNNYGKEDMSYITDNFKNELLKGPYGMIQKLIEAVHFNKEKPENNNIIMPNKNEKMLKILDGDKWIYKDKDETINDLIDWKNFMLDNHYEHLYNIKELTHFLNSRHISTYKRFQKLFDTEGVDLHEQLRKECKLLLLNNR